VAERLLASQEEVSSMELFTRIVRKLSNLFLAFSLILKKLSLFLENLKLDISKIMIGT
jgi:hypothetical protein